MSKKIYCPKCNTEMEETFYAGSSHYKCESCNSTYLLDYQENIVEMFYEDNNEDERECESCGLSLKNGEYTGAWEDGNNSNSYVKCPHCSHINYL